jgi:hypothetical protein
MTQVPRTDISFMLKKILLNFLLTAWTGGWANDINILCL